MTRLANLFVIGCLAWPAIEYLRMRWPISQDWREEAEAEEWWDFFEGGWDY